MVQNMGLSVSPLSLSQAGHVGDWGARGCAAPSVRAESRAGSGAWPSGDAMGSLRLEAVWPESHSRQGGGGWGDPEMGPWDREDQEAGHHISVNEEQEETAWCLQILQHFAHLSGGETYCVSCLISPYNLSNHRHRSDVRLGAVLPRHTLRGTFLPAWASPDTLVHLQIPLWTNSSSDFQGRALGVRLFKSFFAALGFLGFLLKLFEYVVKGEE